MIPEKIFEPGAWLGSRDLVNYGRYIPISPKWLKTRTSNLAGMLPWNIPTEFPEKIFSKGGVAIVT